MDKIDGLEKDSLGRLLRLVEKQQVQMDALHRGLETCREEAAALRECLEQSGALTGERFSAEVHRRRFSEVLKRHPCTMDVCAAEVLQTQELFRHAVQCAGFPTARQCATVSRALLKNMDLLPPRLYAIGGSDGASPLSTVERFNETGMRWESLAAMPTARSNLAVLEREGRLYAIGGTNGGQVLGTVECFDEKGEQWRALPPMPTARGGLAAATTHFHLYAIGGREGFQSLGTLERFDERTRGWETLPPMQSRRRFLAAATLQGKVYAVGGEDDAFAALRTVERFDPATNRWEPVAPMSTRRRGLAAVALRGRLYAIGGGHVAQGNPKAPLALNTVECYNAETNRWEECAPMPTPRSFLAAVVLRGRIYAIGGSDGSQVLQTVECFDTETNTWQTLPPMLTRRGFFAAAVLHL